MPWIYERFGFYVSMHNRDAKGGGFHHIRDYRIVVCASASVHGYFCKTQRTEQTKDLNQNKMIQGTCSYKLCVSNPNIKVRMLKSVYKILF